LFDDLEKLPVQALDERNDFKIDALHGPFLPGRGATGRLAAPPLS
jgi:hypothetical protein